MIVDRAAEVFFAKGYDGASIQDIADAVGILKGSLYHHIDSKEDLLLEIVREVQAGLLAVAAALDGRSSPRQRLRNVVVGHVRFAATHRTKVGVCARDMRALGPEHIRAVESDERRYERVVQGIIAEGQRDGDFLDGLTPKIAAKGVLGMLNVVPAWFDEDGRLSPEEVGEQLATLVLDGLAVRAE